MSGEKTIRTRVFQKNLETLKLLISYPPFQEAIKPIRDKWNIAQAKMEKGEDADLVFFAESSWSIMEQFQLPFHFWTLLSIYIKYNEVDEKYIPDRSYMFKYTPKLKADKNLSPLERVWEIHLVTYSKLTKEEMTLAIKDLEREQKRCFPNTKLFQQTKPRKDIENELEIERLGTKRRPTRIVEEPESYYMNVLRQRSQKEFDEAKKSRKLHKVKIKTKKQKGYSSKGIVKDLKLKVRPNTASKIIQRLKKERRDRFMRSDKK